MAAKERTNMGGRRDTFLALGVWVLYPFSWIRFAKAIVVGCICGLIVYGAAFAFTLLTGVEIAPVAFHVLLMGLLVFVSSYVHGSGAVFWSIFWTLAYNGSVYIILIYEATRVARHLWFPSVNLQYIWPQIAVLPAIALIGVCAQRCARVH
jgi:hypothetical protein